MLRAFVLRARSPAFFVSKELSVRSRSCIPETPETNRTDCLRPESVERGLLAEETELTSVEALRRGVVGRRVASPAVRRVRNVEFSPWSRAISVLDASRSSANNLS